MLNNRITNLILDRALYANDDDPRLDFSSERIGIPELIGYNDWVTPDTIERFDNLANVWEDYNPDHRRFWLANPFQYYYNKYGFRTSEFDALDPEKDTAIFLGCSLTVGIGVAKDVTWTNIVANRLNLNEVNLGISGGSLESAFRVYNAWGTKIPHSYVFLMPSPGIRYESFGVSYGSKFVQMGSWNHVHESYTKDVHEYQIMHGNLNPQIARQNLLKNLFALDYLTQKNGAKLVVTDFRGNTNSHTWNLLGFDSKLYPMQARDYLHPGIPWHRYKAEEVLKMLQDGEH